MPSRFLGLDVGTSATRAVLYDEGGRELAAAQQGYRLQTPEPGFVEQDPEQIWQAIVVAIRRALRQAGGGEGVRALSVASQSGSVIPATAAGEPLYPMITWLDTRARELVEEWRRDGLEELVWRTSGWHLNPGFPLPVIAWLRRYRPQLFADAGRFMGLNDFVIYRLSGEFATDLSSGSAMLLVDLENGQWSDRLCSMAGIDAGMLPALRPSGAPIAPVAPAVSQATGLPRETLVVTGGHDQCCTALAMGITEPGQVLLAAGTAWVLVAVTVTPQVAVIPERMDLSYHVIPRRWTVSQLLGGFGAALAWWLDSVWQPPGGGQGEDGSRPYAVMERSLAKCPAGSRGMFFFPPGAGAQLPGRLEGGELAGLQLTHTRAEMTRALLEGVAYEVRWALGKLGEKGVPVDELWMAGGATQSPTWRQIVADVTGTPIRVADEGKWPARGAALLAATGSGLPAAEVEQMARRPAQSMQPDRTKRRLYDEGFVTYRRLLQERTAWQ